LCVHGGASFLITYTLVQEDPDETTKTMGNRADGLIVPQTRESVCYICSNQSRN